MCNLYSHNSNIRAIAELVGALRNLAGSASRRRPSPDVRAGPPNLLRNRTSGRAFNS